MTTQSLNQKRGLRSWIARIPIALLTLVLVLSAGTWVASASVKSNLTRRFFDYVVVGAATSREVRAGPFV